MDKTKDLNGSSSAENDAIAGSSNDVKNIKDKKEDKQNNDDNNEPKKKIPKLEQSNYDEDDDDDDDDEDQLEVAMNNHYSNPQFFNKLKSSWQDQKDFSETTPDVKIYGEPFRIAILQNFLSDKKVTGLLVNEMEEDVDWSHKQMDLYEFDQTASLSVVPTMYLKKFLKFLETSVQPWLEKLCNLKLKSVSASCSMYNCGDYLLVHDDLLKDRQIAFVYYLSPWEEVDQWTDEMGGCLEIFKTDDNCFPYFPVVRKINPRNNQFVFFKVGSKSFHQVGEVTTSEYPRMTINGWFHGELNTDTVEDSMRPLSKMVFSVPQTKSMELEKVVNLTYLKEDCKNHIQKHIEDNSEICLEKFLKPEIFDKICQELKTNESLIWSIKGPANAQRYETLDLSTLTEPVALLIDTFKSKEMFGLLQDYTDLDLAEPRAITPTVSLELQRWTPGCYTVLGDGSLCDENTLDLMFFLNAADDVGCITYLSPEEENDSDYDESVLLTIKPKDNALNIVYRCEGTTKFTKYVSKLTPIENGPVYVLCCSYKE
ncbi:prolyl 3-hydroxylase sudestada1-like isoform X2 [Episyrphus balteatus]|uniref:prolyl 3-hydroxylase sudestada1-like isoform X2 n=1 Tax=Episyrphus balteatus TaxID=286459 RepID=UPI0024862B23|nr:prolyl 3-hydroxylase sudestada1-like isoform X2 [Episyrphus balteatus]